MTQSSTTPPSPGMSINRAIFYVFLAFSAISLILLIERHYDYDQRFHAQDTSNKAFYDAVHSLDHHLTGKDSNGILKTQPPKQKIAYIFAGSARSFICPRVHWSLKFNAIDAFGGDPYVFVRISTEDNLNTKTGTGKIWTPKYQQNDIEEALKILHPRKVQYFSLQNQIEEMKRYYPGEAHEVFRNNDLRRYSMFFQRCMGYKLVQAYEREHHMTFDWVVLIRLDAGWSGPVLPIESYSKDRVWLTETGYVAYNDQFMLIPRQYSDYLFDLNTKVDRRVYCLGGPDVEVSWKCNRTFLSQQGLSPQKINTTLYYCCDDVQGKNMLGYSETIHYRHFLVGQIPVGFAHFLVYLTRYRDGQCFPDCDRLMYNFKSHLFATLQRSYLYMAKMTPVDSRGVALSLTDTAICYAINDKSSSLWNPPSAATFHSHRLRDRRLDYSQSLLQQSDQMPQEMIFPREEYLPWRIHPTFNVEGCLAFDGKALLWQDCIDHMKRKGGFRHSPQQTFLLSLLPPSNDDHNITSGDSFRSNRTRIMIVHRDPMTFLFTNKIFCLATTMISDRKKVELRRCVDRFEKDPGQWFTVQSETRGSHVLSSVALMRSAIAPDYCIARGNEYEKDARIYVQDGEGLSLRLCNGPNPQLMYFEFEPLQ